MKCSNCGKEVTLQDAAFCPYCARSLKTALKQTVYPSAAGTLAIIAACLALFIAIAGTIGFAEEINDLRFNLAYPNLTLAVFGIWGSTFGFTGGALSIRRRQKALSLASIMTLMASGVAIFLTAYLMLYMTVGIVSLLGIAIILLSVLAVVFAVISRGEFL